MNAAADSTAQRAERIRRVQELENAILGVPALKDAPHADVLTALLAVYIRMAVSHPCCTESCVIQTTKAAFLLAQHSATTTAPQGAPIH